MTTDDKYFRRNMLNLEKQLEALLSQKETTFFRFLTAFLKCALNLEHLEKKDQYPCVDISRIIDSERGAYLNV